MLLVNLGFSLRVFRVNRHDEYQFIADIQSESPIVTHDLSKEGNLIAYSTLKETRVLLLSLKNQAYSLERATLDNTAMPPVSLLSFGRQSDLLYCLNTHLLSSYDIITNTSTPLTSLPSGVVYSQVQQSKNEKFLALGGRSGTQDCLVVLDTDSNKVIYSLQPYLKNRVFKSFKIDSERLFVLYENSKFIVIDFIKNQVNKRTK